MSNIFMIWNNFTYKFWFLILSYHIREPSSLLVTLKCGSISVPDPSIHAILVVIYKLQLYYQGGWENEDICCVWEAVQDETSNSRCHL